MNKWGSSLNAVQCLGSTGTMCNQTHIPSGFSFSLRMRERWMEYDFLWCHGLGWTYCLDGLVEVVLFVSFPSRILPAWFEGLFSGCYPHPPPLPPPVGINNWLCGHLTSLSCLFFILFISSGMLQTLFLGTDIIHSFKPGGKCPPGGVALGFGRKWTVLNYLSLTVTNRIHSC